MTIRDYSPRIVCNGSDHVKEVGGYRRHFLFGGKATLWIGAIFITSLIHIIIPHLLPFVAEEWTVKLATKVMKMRGWTIIKGDL